jgi:protein-tyrosine phosphatase
MLLAEKFRLQRIYDFRGMEEALSAPDIIPGKATYQSLSLSFDKGGNLKGTKFEKDEDLIRLLLENAGHPGVQAMCTNLYDMVFLDEASHDVYRRFFADLMTLQPEDGAVLWHCTQGKDRAGCASAMLLAALGADRELIMADFTLSKSYYDPHVSRIETSSDAQKNAINTLISANPDIFERTLDKIDARYGSLENYLTEYAADVRTVEWSNYRVKACGTDSWVSAKSAVMERQFKDWKGSYNFGSSDSCFWAITTSVPGLCDDPPADRSEFSVSNVAEGSPQ